MLLSAGAEAADEPSQRIPPHLVLVIAEDEYHTDQTLPPFAELNLSEHFRITRVEAAADNPHHLPGLETLDSADLLVLSVRRRPLVPDDLNAIRRYLERGRPLAAIRTSSHAFCRRDGPPPAGLAEWRDFDQTILGCHYRNHHGDQVRTFVRPEPAATTHPILAGMPPDEFPVFGSLYMCGPLTPATTLLMTGRAEQVQPHEPVAWVSVTPHGGRVFYTSLGHPRDFTLPPFVRLLRNGICWAADVPVPATEPRVLVNVPVR
jgi:type 1 glutamine amidotransferase